MHSHLHLASDLLSLPASNVNAAVPSNLNKLRFSIHPRIFQAQKTVIVCAARRRNRYAIQKSCKLMLESALIIASHFRVLPDPVESILREFGGGNGGRNGFWSGFGRGGSGGWRRMGLGMVGILVILGGLGLWWIVGKEMVLDSDTLLGVLGIVLFGLSAEGWRRGVKDWILGFFCCAFLMGLVSTKADFPALRRSFHNFNKRGIMRKRRAF